MTETNSSKKGLVVVVLSGGLD
ncbi:hypothetical protein LCGC14_3102280, partial [marine sediment metagenome]